MTEVNIIPDTPVEPEEIEVPEWQPVLLEVRSMFGDLVTEMRIANQNHLQSSQLSERLLQTVTELTSQVSNQANRSQEAAALTLQASAAATVVAAEAVAAQTPLLDTPVQEGAETVLPAAVVETAAVPAAEKARPKRRGI